MNKFSIFTTFLFMFTLAGCNYNQVVMNLDQSISYDLKFDNSLPDSYKKKISSIFKSSEDTNDKYITLKNYSLKRYDVYGGSALRALEGELTLSIQLMIYRNSETKKKDLKIIKRFKSNELNPYAQNEMINLLESDMQDEVINQVIIEVNTFEM